MLQAFFQMISQKIGSRLGNFTPSPRRIIIKDDISFQNILDNKSEKAMIDINNEIDLAIKNSSAKHNVDSNLIRAIIRAESSYNPNAVSSAGAMGLMQLMPNTAIHLKVSNPFDIHENINAGTQYISQLLNRFDNDIELALAAYNAGQGNVARFGSIPPFPETMEFVPRVLGFKEEYIMNQYKENSRI